jgi:hypothetical protein
LRVRQGRTAYQRAAEKPYEVASSKPNCHPQFPWDSSSTLLFAAAVSGAGNGPAAVNHTNDRRVKHLPHFAASALFKRNPKDFLPALGAAVMLLSELSMFEAPAAATDRE